jgi:D-alanyl-D-alanine carboxypeptidase (penicillin-binding protein 5/6)
VKLRLLAVAAAFALAAPAHAAAPSVAARAYLVENGSTGEILVGYHVHQRLPIASITKLMTVVVALERTKPTELVTVNARAAAVGESTIHLRAGERLPVRDLVEAALIQSANDAANALAAHVGGTPDRFVRLMNRRARQLRLLDTHFARPDGLDARGHVSSARDVSVLARVAMRDPLVRDIVRRRSATIAGDRRLHTWNDLLGRFPSLIGVKTGHTDAAGWSEVAAARGPGVTIYATLMGSPSRSQRNEDLAALLEWGLAQYRVATLVRSGHVYAQPQTQFGRGSVRLVAERPLRRVVRVGRPLVERIVFPAGVALPVERGERLGEVRIYEGRRLVGSRALVAERSISSPGFAGRARWYVRRTAHHLWGFVT